MKDSAAVGRSLPSLVSSRICHDLVNPLGAIGNGLELLQLAGRTDGPELNLMSESIAHAAARLSFFRIAFGLAGGGQALSPDEIRAITDAYYHGSRMKIVWHPALPVPRSEVRLAMLLILCAETALPRGGTVELRNGGVRWVIGAAGQSVALDEDLQAVLSGYDFGKDINAGQVHFVLAAEAARALGRPIAIDIGAEDLEFSF